jgi:hypothetical protein
VKKQTTYSYYDNRSPTDKEHIHIFCRFIQACTWQPPSLTIYSRNTEVQWKYGGFDPRVYTRSVTDEVRQFDNVEREAGRKGEMV